MKYVSNAKLLEVLERVDRNVAFLREVAERVLPGSTKPTFPPIDVPRDPPIAVVPCGPSIPLPHHSDPLPTPSLPPSRPSDGGPTDSMDFDPSQPGRHHKKELFAGQEVVYTLPAGGMRRASFSASTWPAHGPPWQGEHPALTYWVTDAAGREVQRPVTLGINAGEFMVTPKEGTNFTGPIYLHLKTTDHSGWFIVQYRG